MSTLERTTRRYLPAVTVLVLSVLLVAGSVRDAAAEIVVVAHYRFPSDTPRAVGTAAPDVLPDTSENGHDLRRVGHPALSHDAPVGKKEKVSGAVVFDGVDDRYEAGEVNQVVCA